MSDHKLNDGKPEYGEPWIYLAGGICKDVGDLEVVNCGKSPSFKYSMVDDTKRANRICNLINLFEGVSDEHIQNLSYNSSINKLIRALLLNPLESVPLAMLVDEIQETPEYQKQVGCYRSWLELYHKLLEIADMIDPDTKRYNYELIRTARRSLASEIRNFLAPVQGLIESRKPYQKGETT